MGVRVAGVRKEVKTEGEQPLPELSQRPFVSSADGFWTATGKSQLSSGRCDIGEGQAINTCA